METSLTKSASPPRIRNFIIKAVSSLSKPCCRVQTQQTNADYLKSLWVWTLIARMSSLKFLEGARYKGPQGRLTGAFPPQFLRLFGPMVRRSKVPKVHRSEGPRDRKTSGPRWKNGSLDLSGLAFVNQGRAGSDMKPLGKRIVLARSLGNDA